jgi:D-cysteine desulfhydrase
LTASWCCKENLACHLVLEERVKGSYKPEASGNNFLFEMLDVKSITVVPGGSDMMAAMGKKAEELKSQGKKPYIVPGGASNAIGALGYVVCGEEIMNQLNTSHLNIDHIIVPSGSAGTHAGIVVGMVGTNANIPVSGVNVSRPKDVQENIVYKLAEETARKLGIQTAIPRGAVVCYDQYVGPGYSLPTDSMVEAVKLFAKHEAILLDPVYSGKAAAGLIDLVRKGPLPPARTSSSSTPVVRRRSMPIWIPSGGSLRSAAAAVPARVLRRGPFTRGPGAIAWGLCRQM